MGKIHMTLCSRALLLSSLVIGVIGGGLPAQADPIRVSGGLVSGTAAAGVQTYKGIPYAKPPVGDLPGVHRSRSRPRAGHGSRTSVPMFLLARNVTCRQSGW